MFGALKRSGHVGEPWIEEEQLRLSRAHRRRPGGCTVACSSGEELREACGDSEFAVIKIRWASERIPLQSRALGIRDPLARGQEISGEDGSNEVT